MICEELSEVCKACAARHVNVVERGALLSCMQI